MEFFRFRFKAIANGLQLLYDVQDTYVKLVGPKPNAWTMSSYCGGSNLEFKAFFYFHLFFGSLYSTLIPKLLKSCEKKKLIF